MKSIKMQLNTRTKRDASHTMLLKYLMNATLVVTVFLLSCCVTKQIKASGVFELELIKFQPLNTLHQQRPLHEPTKIENASLDTRTIEHTSTNHQRQDEDSNLLQVLVCLKEAFTSQLDGPCTFGNATIALNQESSIQTDIVGSVQDTHTDQVNATVASSSSIQPQHQQGSLTTNTVRILFTFRWTKSFTIILSAEQTEATRNSQPTLTQDGGLFTKSLTADRHISETGGTNTTLVQNPPSVNQRSKLSHQHQPHQTGAIGPETMNRSHLIDRHVLTENEVLPNLETNPNKPWSSRYSRSLKSSIAYRFRVYCSLNYYGDGCTTFCRARDDQFGHYNCSSLGQKICLDGWYGADCDKAKCRTGCNQQHGYCEKPDTCQCRPGWGGPRCDECITYPGCQNGYCLSPWQCICQRNWGGVLCDQDLNYCGTHEPCKNNGTCQNIAPGNYKCNCPHGFTGVDCDISLNLNPNIYGSLSAGCVLNPCLNGGTCYGFNTLLDLVSSSTVSLTNKTAPQQESFLQEEHESQKNRQYRCQCLTGWTGDYCQWPDSPSMAVTSFVVNNASSSEKLASESQNLTNYFATSSYDDLIDRNFSETTILTSDKSSPPIYTTIIENSQSNRYLDMKHLISWVVIASVLGVLLATLLLAWCCIIAIERNKFSFIQMNIVRDGEIPITVRQSTFRRMHEKIRDSIRRSSKCRVRTESKLGGDDIVRSTKPPPPPYEESGTTHLDLEKTTFSYPSSKSFTQNNTGFGSTTNKPIENLVIGTVSGQEQPLPTKGLETHINPAEARLSCPRHGHLYRMHQLSLHREKLSDSNLIAELPSVVVSTKLPTHFHDESHPNHHHHH